MPLFRLRSLERTDPHALHLVLSPRPREREEAKRQKTKSDRGHTQRKHQRLWLFKWFASCLKSTQVKRSLLLKAGHIVKTTRAHGQLILGVYVPSAPALDSKQSVIFTPKSLWKTNAKQISLLFLTPLYIWLHNIIKCSEYQLRKYAW